jgi:hypothetical protein
VIPRANPILANAARQLRSVEGRIAQLQAVKSEFKRMLAQCRGGRIADCRIIEILRDHTMRNNAHQSIFPNTGNLREIDALSCA